MTSAVLALQGSVEPHVSTLERLGETPRRVRRPSQLGEVTHLIVPGGESTTLHKLLEEYELWDEIGRRGRDGSLALFGTCAGAILMGRPSTERPPRLGLVDVAVDRNAYGRQVDSFVAAVEPVSPLEPLDGVFIRAPKLRDPGPAVEILATLDDRPVLVREGRILLSTFHPELTSSASLHRYFLSL